MLDDRLLEGRAPDEVKLLAVKLLAVKLLAARRLLDKTLLDKALFERCGLNDGLLIGCGLVKSVGRAGSASGEPANEE